MEGMAKPTVWIVGTIGVQNNLTSEYLTSSKICKCEAVEPQEAAARVAGTDAPALLLLDMSSCPANDRQLILQEQQDVSQNCCSPAVALINVNALTDCRSILQCKRIIGIFRESTPPAVFVRGVQSLLRGEYWFPRETLNHYLDQTRRNLKHPLHPPNSVNSLDGETVLNALTPKELTVLEALAHGASTESIATEMHVSTNTVKTHLYNLYRKLEVHNRVEAVVWAHSHRHKMRQ